MGAVYKWPLMEEKFNKSLLEKGLKMSKKNLKHLFVGILQSLNRKGLFSKDFS